MSWICSNCDNQIESQFRTCWNCGSDIDGRVDDGFSVESDPVQLQDEPETPRVRCLKCGYRGKVLFSTKYKSWWEWVVSGLVSILISQRSWIHFSHKICPNCEAENENLTHWSEDFSPGAEQVWDRAIQREERQAGQHRKLVCLVFIAAIGVIIILRWSI